eukprot:Skav204847  [mRNA]  locus=scaffold1883:90419:91570:- [translate_table: standard]
MLKRSGRSLCLVHVQLRLCVIALLAIHSLGENVSTSGVCENENEVLLQKMFRTQVRRSEFQLEAEEFPIATPNAKSFRETDGKQETHDSKGENIRFQAQTSDGHPQISRQQSPARPRVRKDRPDSADSFLQVSQTSDGQASQISQTRRQSGRHHSARFVKHHMVHHDQEPPPQHSRKHTVFQSIENPTDPTDPEQGSDDPTRGATPGVMHVTHTHPRKTKPGPRPKVFFDDHRHMGLPQWFEQKKTTVRSLMFEKCPPKKHQALPQMAVSTSNASNGSSIKVPCNSGQLVGYWSGSEFISHCCEEDYCVGCAVLNATDGTCEQCMAGYVRKAVANRTECIICDDDRSWTDEDQRTCYDFEQQGLCSNGVPPGDNKPFQSLRQE